MTYRNCVKPTISAITSTTIQKSLLTKNYCSFRIHPLTHGKHSFLSKFCNNNNIHSIHNIANQQHHQTRFFSIVQDAYEEIDHEMMIEEPTEIVPSSGAKKHKLFSRNLPTTNTSTTTSTNTTMTRNEFTNHLKNLSKSNVSEKKFEEYLKLFPAERFDNYIYTLIMHFYTTKHNFAMVEKVLKNIKTPDRFVFTELLKAYSLEGNEKKAEEVFRKITNPDIFIYNSMLTVYARQRNIEKFEQLLQELKLKGSPNRITYSIILDAYFKVESFDKVDTVFEEIAKQCETGGIEQGHIDIQLVNTYLTCLVHSTQYQKALDCFNKYVLGENIEHFPVHTRNHCSSPLGVKPNERTILLMLCAFEGMKDEKNFENLLNIMRYYKIKSNIYIASKLMQHFFERKEFKKVIDVFTFSSFLQYKCYYALVRYISQSYAALDDTEHLLQFIKLLEEQGGIQYFNVHSLIYALALVKQPQEAEKLFHKYKSQTSDTSYLLRMYNAMLLCLIRSGLKEEAVQFYKSYPFEPDSTTKRILREKFDRHPNDQNKGQ
ncbi:hypothetical protein C9374_001441 [Naegleria lovaniensis]|uniref:Uncharacterized protein n=1 Tax=Naegleria lovaniensis TaxID=51637 RepID=A0AA88GS32_NAELO|nr:uncharacterized protein C9374_001441 [Naegleria lovaniensis]KAG2387847.1 hypothetical protein C9374_001441 [Naegleria lovaniensis]